MRRTKEEAQKTREAVLNAAAQIIVRLGISAFTIDAVAQEAGITKGGVLHHFPSKEALLNGLIDQVTQGFRAKLDEALEQEPAGQPGRWLRAYIRTIFSVQFENINLMPALAATVAADPQMIERIRRSMQESQVAAVNDGLDPTTATLIRLAVDGVVFTKAFSLNVIDKETSQHVYEALFGMTNPVSAQVPAQVAAKA